MLKLHMFLIFYFDTAYFVEKKVHTPEK